MTAYQSIPVLWKHLLVEDPGRSLLRIARTDNQKLIHFRCRSLFTRVHRFASGFAARTGLKAGARVAILANPSSDFAVVLHGLWLLQMTAVVIDWKEHAARLVDEFKELELNALIVDLDGRSKVASLLSHVPTLEHWFVIGASPGEEPEHRYEALLEGMLDQRLASRPSEEDAEALILYSQDVDRRICRSIFSQSSLCLQGLIWQQHFPENQQDNQLAFVSAPAQSFEFIFFNFIVSFFSGVPFLLDPDIEVKRLWEHVKSDGLTWLYLTQSGLLSVLKRGRPSLWETPKNLVLYVGTECPLSSVVLREFEDTFSILVFTTFARPECGGVLSIFPQNLGYEAQRAWLVDQPIPSSGMVLDHVEIRFIDEFKYEVNQAIRGQLELRLAGMDEWIQTGLDGFYAEDNKDRRHIFIFGEHTDGILRFGHYINLARIDAVIRNLRGVAFGMAVGFSNSFAGLEVGAYMVPVRALAHEIDDHEWLAQLRLLLPYEECPKVIVRGAYPSVYGDWPTREEVLERFKKFRKIDYAKLNA